jgi:hypothetical protein
MSLLSVDPGMYPEQWSDVKFTSTWFKEKTQSPTNVDLAQGNARREFRGVCLLPYINLQSLKDDPARLLNILYNRVAYPVSYPDSH